jgi:hypothetical protein
MRVHRIQQTALNLEFLCVENRKRKSRKLGTLAEFRRGMW